VGKKAIWRHEHHTASADENPTFGFPIVAEVNLDRRHSAHSAHVLRQTVLVRGPRQVADEDRVTVPVPSSLSPTATVSELAVGASPTTAAAAAAAAVSVITVAAIPGFGEVLVFAVLPHKDGSPAELVLLKVLDGWKRYFCMGRVQWVRSDRFDSIRFVEGRHPDRADWKILEVISVPPSFGFISFGFREPPGRVGTPRRTSDRTTRSMKKAGG
jgi:hypothetical protein